jgi:hypothetical protein
MFVGILLILCILLAISTIVSIYYTLKFARIIFIVEDDLSESIESLESSLKVFEKILGMRLFFDSPEVRPILMDAIAEIKTSKLAVQGIVSKFTERSKQKYVRLEEPDEDENL